MESQHKPAWDWRFKAFLVVFMWISVGAGAGLYAFWPAAWLIPIVSAYLFLNGPRSEAYALTLVGYGAGTWELFSYYHDRIHMPLPLAILSWLGPGLVLCLAVMLWHRLVKQGQRVIAPLVAGAAWVVFFFGYHWFTGEATMTYLSYSQADFLPFAQLASVGGIWVLEFFLIAIPLSLATVWPDLMDSKRPEFSNLRPQLALLSLFCLSLLWGGWRLLQPIPGPTMNLAALGTDLTGRAAEDMYAAALPKLRSFDYVVFPEKTVSGKNKDLSRWDDLIRASRVPGAVVGMGDDEGTPRNIARIYRNGSSTDYVKHHLVPVLEKQYLAGDQLTQFEDGAAVQICRDMHYPELSREYSRRGAGLMLVPAWDFDIDREQAERSSRMRSIEGGFAQCRASREGLLTVNDAYGRVLAREWCGNVAKVARAYSVPVGHVRTLYAMLGDWAAYGCVLILVAAGTWSLRSRWAKGS